MFSNVYEEKYAIQIEKDGISYVFFRDFYMDKDLPTSVQKELIKTSEFGTFEFSIDSTINYESYNHDGFLILSDTAFKHKRMPIIEVKDEIENLSSLINGELVIEMRTTNTQMLFDNSRVYNQIENILIPNTPKNVTLIELTY